MMQQMKILKNRETSVNVFTSFVCVLKEKKDRLHTNSVILVILFEENIKMNIEKQ